MNIINNISNRRHRASILLAMAGACVLQAGAVKGVVIDEYGQPVAQAQITVKGTSTSVLTDIDGMFDLDLTSEKTLKSMPRAILSRNSMWTPSSVRRTRIT